MFIAKLGYPHRWWSGGKNVYIKTASYLVPNICQKIVYWNEIAYLWESSEELLHQVFSKADNCSSRHFLLYSVGIFPNKDGNSN